MSTFSLADDAIAVEEIPRKKLYSGDTIPAIGLGTFGSDTYDAATVSAAVKEAIALGFRHIDCASVYANEKEIGEVFADVLASGAVTRDELWITSKLWNDKHDPADVIPSCKQSLQDLGLDYLDLYLVHWPFPNFHPVGCTVDSRSSDAKPYIHENYMKTWAELEKLVDMGLVRNIGTSNMTIPKLSLVLRDARIKPACNEMELHPHFQQQELFDYCVANDIVPIGYSPIGSPARPERDKTAEDTVDIEDPAVVAIAERLGVHPAVVCIKWAIQRGQIPIPFSVKRDKIRANLAAATTQSLTEDEMAAIEKNDKNCRLIKGQVFLWKENQSWEDLWDLSGEITPP
jgi:diketogulonate reductase-like aldo/keto reductase